jgi:hypothetical protein
MRITLFSACFFCLFLSYQAYSQKFTIKTTDATHYPVIRSIVELHDRTDRTPPQPTDFTVTEDDKKVEFTLDKQANVIQAEDKAIFILVEASGYTYGKASEDIKQAVTEALTSIPSGTHINVGYFGRADQDGKSLHVLNDEFTTDKSGLTTEISKISAPKDTNYVVDVYKGIYETLTYIGSQAELPIDKRLIIISTAINNSRSSIGAEDCIDKAVKASIPLYTVAYKTRNRYAPDNFARLSDRTNGKMQTAKTLAEIQSAITSAISNENTSTTELTKDYILEFKTANPDDGKMYKYEVVYKGEKQAVTYTAPEGEGNFNSSLYIVPIVLGIAGILAWFLVTTQKKKRVMEAQKQQEQEAILRENEAKERQTQAALQASPLPAMPPTIPTPSPAPTPAQPTRDLKKTVIVGGGSAPVLIVSAGNLNQQFPLTRPSISIGRTPGNDLVIPEPTVSGKHATLTNENGIFYIVDAGSTNGTFVNTARITGKQMLKAGDVIRMGGASLKFQV